MIHSDDNGGAGGGGAKAATPIGQVGVKIPDGKQQLGNSGREEEKRQDKWIEDLPTLPIPDLEKTMERYLDGLESVIQSTLQMEQTRLIVKDFLYGNNDNNDDDHSEGKRLQKLLIEYAKQTDNWVS
uniref:Carnitine O-acetyltransferase-like n=1 Tax=Dermatophagoides pteronyssinus TaxID=6956 RepID=A0A6P6YDD7_DERPT